MRGRIIFVPGGPGFSSHPEATLLGPRLRERGWSATFWGEPWRSDPSVAVSWSNYLRGLSQAIEEFASRPLTIVAHSFAVHPVAAVLNNLKRADCRLVLVAPTFDIRACYQTIVRLAAQGLSTGDPELARVMLEAAGRSQGFFDEPMQQALGIASTDPTLFPRYWIDRDAFTRFAGCFESPGASFDLNCFVTLSSELYQQAWLLPDIENTPGVAAVAGGGDPIGDLELTRATLAHWAPGAPLHVLEACGHYPHLEAPDRFCALLERF